MFYVSLNGYKSSFFYSLGKDSNYNFIGWNGNSTIAIETILENIVTLNKKNSILPKVYINFRKNKDVTYRSAKIKYDNIWSSLGGFWTTFFTPYSGGGKHKKCLNCEGFEFFEFFFCKYSWKYNLPPVPKWPKLSSNFW